MMLAAGVIQPKVAEYGHVSCLSSWTPQGDPARAEPPPLALEAGEDLAAVSRALGHASVALTADVYLHVTPSMRDGLAARMEAVLEA